MVNEKVAFVAKQPLIAATASGSDLSALSVIFAMAAENNEGFVAEKISILA